MNRQFNKSETTKAVAAGVQKGSILDAPRGQWHNWDVEVFVFILKLILIISLITLYSNLTASDYIESNHLIYPVKANIIDLEPNEPSLSIINERFMLNTISNTSFTKIVNESQSGDSASAHSFYSRNLKKKADNESPLFVIDWINTYSHENKTSHILFKKLKRTLEIYFDESQKPRKKVALIINRKNDNI